MIAALVLSALVAAASPAPRPGEPVEEDVHQNSLVGEYAAPGDVARHPAVLILGGFEGGIPRGEAFGFARQGYAALSIAYFGAAPLPKSVDEIPVEAASRAIDFLIARPEVDPNRIGIVGVSKGAELALLAAARDARIRSVAVISPSAYVWFAPVFDGGPDRSSWTMNNGAVPFIPPDRTAEAALAQAYQSNGTFAMRDLYDASLKAAPAATVDAATIPVERFAGALLCIAGDDDREWDSAASCRTIQARRHAAQRDARDASSSSREPVTRSRSAAVRVRT